ncbi:MAG: CDP-glycerol glycerophosphotransferase family protein, partial [Clostridia bacterium]|nr:CDP-glycerol glycerophosphotransferase family protein [Clostridia bacterium]
FKVVYACKTLDGGENSSLAGKVSYALSMLKQMYHLSTSKACILDSYNPVISVLKHKKSRIVIQIWHTVGKLKEFGWQIVGRQEGTSPQIANVMKMHKNYDVIYYAGEGYKEVFKEGFRAEDCVFRKFTLPRIDLLFDKDYIENTRRRILEKYPQLNEKPNVLYAPTFRKDENLFERYFNELLAAFDFEKYNLIVMLHPLTKISVNDQRITVARDFSTFQMMTCADKMISDYSCIIYEAGLKGIPLYFYCYDLDKYENNRGLTISYEELPGFKSKNAKELVDSLDKPYDFEALREFIDCCVENKTDCTKKMAKDIVDMCSDIKEIR